VRSTAYATRVDTNRLADPGRYELDVGLKAWIGNAPEADSLRCTLPRFRMEGEHPCVTSNPQISRDIDLLYGHGWSRLYGGDRARLEENVTIVADSTTCEAAGKHYGAPDDPPRSVIVLESGMFYFVYDPDEPVRAGEWTVRKVFTRKWEDVGRF
jgi:hypothetical protein